MARIVVLDSWPLGLASNVRGKPEPDRCRAWLDALYWANVLVVVPGVADFEVRRELIRNNKTAGILRLDRLIDRLIYAPVTRTTVRRAAEYWAHVRQLGLPTASDSSLDADCIIAAQASLVCGHGDTMTIATANVDHLIRFPGIDARRWEDIQP